MRQLVVGLSDKQMAKRRDSIGGSDANIIASGDETRILDLWEQKTGRKPPLDLSDNLAAMMGTWTEELNRYWFERKTGHDITDDGAERAHAEYSFLTSTLDGLTRDRRDETAIFEAKHTNPFGYDADAMLDRYLPQLHHNMYVAGASRAVLSMFVGTDRWDYIWVDFDPFYHATLLEQEMVFWQAVESDTPPAGITYVEPSEQEGELRSVDMTGNNEWADLSATYFETAALYNRHREAQTGLKALVTKDVGHAEGHGLLIKRDKRGALRFYDVRDKDDGSRKGRAAGADEAGR